VEGCRVKGLCGETGVRNKRKMERGTESREEGEKE
jgi:hypothetical protein